MKVQAAEGLLVPKEADPRSYFGPDAEEVDPTAYIIRRLATGELLDAEALPAEAPAGKAKATKP
jgi:hypothetical protein